MMFRVVALVSLVLVVGCTTAQARKAHRASEYTTACGLVGMLVAGTTASALPAHETTILTAGLVFVPISVFGALVYIATDEKANERAAPKLTRRERKRLEAWELTKQAGQAAREQDCMQVEAIHPRVRALDLDFHGHVFMRDVAIQRCLARTGSDRK